MKSVLLNVNLSLKSQNHKIFDSLHYDSDTNVNVMDALYQMVLDFSQNKHVLNIIILAVTDGYDHSEHGVSELRAQILQQRNVKIIISQYITSHEQSHAFKLQFKLQDSLPGYVKVFRELTYDQLQQYCCLYEKNQVSIVFGMSNIISMQNHIQQVRNLFFKITEKYQVNKIYLICGQIRILYKQNENEDGYGNVDVYVDGGENINLIHEQEAQIPRRAIFKQLSLYCFVLTLVIFIVILISWAHS